MMICSSCGRLKKKRKALMGAWFASHSNSCFFFFSFSFFFPFSPFGPIFFFTAWRDNNTNNKDNNNNQNNTGRGTRRLSLGAVRKG
ncbi:hypothetical protein BO71DRAFT_29027 [Aspergillus ellipticus CBS 707.79]|uniref:Uncharacterized protein n=1 Tax=Aspergillus ellipticus CBS 707.79 TaxID=1448320 RepID=A0A319EMS1_9EURO|nr:hypothetical protein BO71DRAFT_29027 [Aspergillus ellipticus CBS 707.79]